MIVGGGMIASALVAIDQPDILLLASGVSNAKGHIAAECERELQLLQRTVDAHPEKTACYISSYSVNDENPQFNTPYLQHKANMEQYIRGHASRYLIVRTSNVVGFSKQPGNLMNFIFNNLKSGHPFEVWANTSRNLIDVTDLAQMIGYYLFSGSYSLNKTVYMINPDDVSILSIVRHFEAQICLTGRFELVNKGVYYHCDNQLATELFEKLNISRTGYTKKLIKKFFSSRSLS